MIQACLDLLLKDNENFYNSFFFHIIEPAKVRLMPQISANTFAAGENLF